MPCACNRVHQRDGVGAAELGVWRVLPSRPIHTQEMPKRTSCSIRVGAEDVGGGEDVQRPGLVVRLHQLQQAQGPLAVEQEVLIHDEEGADLHVAFEAQHHLEQLVAGLVEINALALAPEHGGGAQKLQPTGQPTEGISVAAIVAGAVAAAHPHRAGADARVDADGGWAGSPARPGSGGTTARPRRAR